MNTRDPSSTRARAARAGSVLACVTLATLLVACGGTTSRVSSGGWSTMAALPAGLTGSPTPSGPTASANPRIVTVDLGQTSASAMFIHMSATTAPAGTVTFVVTNTDSMTHEFVVLRTDTPAGAFPISSFEGESNRIDEDAAGTNVGETGDMEAGTSMLLTIDLTAGHYAVVCNLPGHYAAGMHEDFWATPKGAVVTVDLGQTSASAMFIHMSATTAPAGTVTFVVTNTDSMTHEFVVLRTDTPAGAFPISSFEGESNRIDEDAAGTNVGETGDMEAGTSMLLTIDLTAGHYAVVCNLPGHYAAGMHEDFWATPKGAVVTVDLGQTSASAMFIHMSATTAPAGTVTFVVTNTDSMTHEFVVLRTDTPAGAFPISSFEGESNRIDEDAAGTNVGETGDMEAGTSMLLTIDLTAGHYAVVCNLPGHYAAGMHEDFWATPKGAVVTVDLGQTSASAMFIHMSATTAPAGTVTFVVTNTDSMTHEFVVLRTDTPAGAFPISSFEGESNRIDEDAAGTNVGETGDMEAGTSMLLTIDLTAGHYAVVCNLPGHYAAGMHEYFWAA